MVEVFENPEGLPEEAASELIERLGAVLPDDFSESKDWKAGGVVERIEWLKIFNNVHRKEIERVETQLIEILEQLDETRERAEKYRTALLLLLNQYRKSPCGQLSGSMGQEEGIILQALSA